MKYYIIAGEASGDLHASNLMRGILNNDSTAEFRFLGGELMAQQGGVMAKHYREMSFMGFWEVLVNIRQILRNLKFCKKDILEFKPDTVVLVDYPGFNLRIARFAKQSGFKVFYYIAPKVWAWNESRVKILKKYVDHLLAIFPFEREYFKQHGITVAYYGNPLVDALLEGNKGGDFFKSNNLDSKPIVAILAGSRVQEIKYNLPILLSVVDSFPDYQFVIAGAPSLSQEIYNPYIKNNGVKIVFNQTHGLLRNSVAALVTSGTATLEAALIGVPEVVCYKGSFISMLIASIFIKIKYISLVNLIMQKEVVKELIQYKLNTRNLAKELNKILPNQLEREKMLSSFAELKALLGEAGASERFAKHIVDNTKQ